MSNCINCKNLLDVSSKFCPTCGTNQESKSISVQKTGATKLKVLCVLTIIGSFFTIGRALLYEAIAHSTNNDEYIRGWVYGISSIVTIIGAISMLNKKETGLITYTIGQTVYILTVIWATIVYTSMKHGFGGISIIISLMFLIPSIFFLWIYWTQPIRKQFS